MKRSIRMRKIATASAFFFLGMGSLFAQQTISVEEAVRRALENNLQIRQAEFQESLSEQDLLQSRMNFYPTLNVGSSWGMNWGLSFDQTAGRLVTQSVNSAGARLSSSFDLFNGFQKINQVKANRYQLLGAQSNVDRIKNDLILNVLTNYLEVLTNYDLLQASEEQLTLSRQQLKVMEINIEAGNMTLADLYQSQSQVATDELNVTTSNNAYELALLNLKQLMEMDPNASIVLERPEVDEVQADVLGVVADQIYNQAVQNYPDIKVAEYNSLVARQNIEIARSGYYPSLSVSAGIGTNYSSQARDFATQQILPFGSQIGRNRSESIGISLNIPIFNNYRTRISVNRAKINYDNALTNEQLAKNNLNKIIHQAVLDLNSAESRLRSTEVALTSATQAFDVIQLRFDEGMANTIELNTSQIAMNRAQFDQIQAKYNLIFRAKVIDFYLGNPITF